MGYKCTTSEATKYGCSMLAVEAKSESWMNMRPQVFLIEFYRETEPVEDDPIRRVADKVKVQNYAKAIVCASSGFTRSAASFAENRPVELVDRETLENTLSKAGI